MNQSFLHVKSFDLSGRKFSGIATTPDTDRVGDIVDPLGVTFTNPLPLLLFHNSSMPVGRVKLGKPTAAGIPFEAEIPEVTEPGAVKDLTDQAAHFVKYKLIRGVSIGFRPLEDAIELIKTGVKFLATEVLELSLVPIPANADATILSIKSADHDRAALGVGQDGVTPKSAGVSASVRLASRNAGTMTITEQIKAYKDTRRDKVDKRAALMTKSGDELVTLSPEQEEEYDTLDTEIKALDKHIVRLEALEVENKAAAVPVNGAKADEASASRGGVTVVAERLEKGIEFARYAMCLAAAKGNTTQALEIAKNRFPTMTRIHTVIKAAVGAGTTTDPQWAGTLVDYANFAGDFIEFLRPQTIIGKFGTGNIPSLTRIPFMVKIQGQTSGGAGYWVGQGQAKPLTSFDFEPTTLGFSKVANIAVLTDELVRFSSPSAEVLVRQALADALIARLDTDFVDPNKAADSVSPASITNGVTPIQTAGSSQFDVDADIEAIYAPFLTANNAPSTGVWIMSTTTALRLSLMKNALGQKVNPELSMTGGTFNGLPVIVSDYVANSGSPTNDLVILLNARDIYLADDGQVTIDASREASLEMSSTPTNASAAVGSPYAPTATQMVSLWQTNSIGIKAERYINWKKRRSTAVQYLDNVIWGRGGGSPA